MVSLIAPDPWPETLATMADDLARDVAAARPDLAHLEVIGDRAAWRVDATIATPATVPGRRGAAWLIAVAVAPCWPGWLNVLDVPLRLSVPGLIIDADAATMTAVGTGQLLRPGFWSAATTTLNHAQ